MRQGNSMLGGISTCSDSAHLSHLRNVADVVDAVDGIWGKVSLATEIEDWVCVAVPGADI